MPSIFPSIGLVCFFHLSTSLVHLPFLSFQTRRTYPDSFVAPGGPEQGWIFIFGMVVFVFSFSAFAELVPEKYLLMSLKPQRSRGGQRRSV